MNPLHALRQALREAQLDALWVSQPENVRYLSHFSSPEDGRVLLTEQAATLYTDARYTTQAREESELEQHIARGAEVYAHARAALEGKRVGIEAHHLTVAEFQALQADWPQSEVVAASDLIGPLRLIKSPAEVQAIREAQAIADAAFAEVLPRVVAGVSERQVAADLEAAMRRLGAAGPAFETIVASGVRGALPHGHATDKLLREGELVTLDFGAQKGGYHSDMTRTVPIGPQSEENRRLYRAVLEAEEAAIAAVRPGVNAADLDRISRTVLARYGLEDYFVHSLGHGVGLNIHEGPRISRHFDEELRAGMVITIEPGVYLPGQTGLRIEDLLLVTPEGHELLSHSPKAQL